MELQDFEVTVRANPEGNYAVSVDRSPGGETNRQMRMPYDGLALENRLQQIQIALLSSVPGRRRISSDAEKVVREFGQALFDALFADEVRNLFDVSRARCLEAGKGLRIRLSFDNSALAGLPWEFMFDERSGDFVCLSEATPVVRYLRIGQPPRPLTVEPPLRVLGLIASPSDRAALDTAAERERLENALADLRSSNRVELHWAAGDSWRALQHELRHGPWHVFHFVGHGGFDSRLGEGVLALVGDGGGSELVSATNLGRLLGDHQPMRLAVLNACEGARADDTDIFSSVATTLVRRGTPAVLGMQYEITDTAAIEVARVFYEAIADGMPVDLALTDARKAVCLAMPGSLEWGVPVLYTHTDNGVLFELTRQEPRAVPSDAPSDPPPAPPPIPAAVPAAPPPPPPAPPAPAVPAPTRGDQPSEGTAVHRRTRVLIALVTAAVIAAIVIAIVIWRPGSGDTPKAAGVIAPISVPNAHELAAGDSDLWVATTTPTGRVVAIDPRTGVIGRTQDFNDRVGHVAEAAGRVWVTAPARHVLVPLDARDLTPQQSIAVGASPNDLEVGGDNLFLSDSQDGAIRRIDPRTSATTKLTSVGQPLADLTFRDGEVWAAQLRGPTLYRVDANTGARQPFNVGQALIAVLSFGDSIWVTDIGTDAVLRVDPNDPTHPKSIPVGPRPWGLAAGGGAVWVVIQGADNTGPSTVARIDPQTNKVTKTFTVGAGADGVVWMDDALWVASEGAGQVTRITG